MQILSIVMACFAALGALDLVFGNKLGIGKEFENGIAIMGKSAMSVVGVITLAPLLSFALRPALSALSNVIPFDPSSVVGLLLANDMGASSLATELALTPKAATFNGLIVGSMLGVNISFSIPLAMSIVEKEKQNAYLLGTVCGFCAVPLGCLVGGVALGMTWRELIVNLAPLVIVCAIVTVLLLKAPVFSVKLFRVIGLLLKSAAIVGLATGIFLHLTGISVPHLAPVTDGFDVVVDSAIFSAGAFPFVAVLSALLKKPLCALGKKANLSPASTVGFLSSLATNLTTFALMRDMDEKGVVLNSAFSVSASFVFASHLAFTLLIDPSAAFPMIAGKLVGGFAAIVFAWFVFDATERKKQQRKKKKSPAPKKFGTGFFFINIF